MFKMKIVLVILTALLNISMAVKTNHNLCPFQLLCSCINVNGTKTVTVTCQGMRNLMSVKNVVKHLKSKPIKLLKVKRCAEKNLAFPVFNNLTIFEIRINCPLRTIADKAFVETHSLTRLKISSSSLQKIPAAINQVKALKTLAIVGGPLTRIGGRLQNMTELEKLSLKHNRIKEITAHTFSGDKKLQSIILARNKLRSIAPGTFDPCPNLNLVDLEDNYLQTVDGLFNNPNLKVINLKRNDLTSLEEAFNDIMDIEELHLNGNKNLTYISDKALGFNLHNLLKLSLRECGLEKVSKAFLIPFSHLEELDLSCNSLRIIPDGFFNNLENLIKVTLKNNRLRSVKNCFGQNYRLEHIDLSDNLIESCDNTFHSMASLKSIDLSRNRLRWIKNTDFSTSPWLRKLSLNINNISQIDSEAFSHLKQLQIINLSENELKNLNGSFRNTPYLRELILHSNGLGELNENDFSAAGRVTRLNLANTNLSRVHGAFKNLSNLKSLTIRKNKLSVLSRESFPRIIKIREMFSSENKWICDCRLLWIKDWMQNTNLRNLNLDFNCSSPIHFKSKKLSQLTKEDLVSWPKDDCPSPCECSCVADGEERYVNVNCSSRELREITDANETVCSYRDGKESLRGRLIMNLSEIEFCPELLRNYILMGAGSLMTLMMTVTSFVVYFRYRYHLRVWLYSRGFRCLKNRDKRDTGKLYDAYISFSDEDAEMVRHHFLPELEEKHPFYKLFVPQRDLKAGNFEINNLMEQVLDSKRAIILLSRHYLKNEFCMEIFRVAFANSLEEKLHRVILVKFGPLPPMNHEPSTHEPSTMMESSRSLKFGTRLFWDMLQYEMPEKRPRSTNNYELLDDKSGDVPLIEEF
ncbi:protein toll isoform X2 [Parasteatoda tepidariorum]|uniref:protein toll isoform X2 n=1 Tax=Parasteatoda tepidariorum TaxID=114398 RepID=UPI001C7299A0|nr:slit homolog 2 protein isoform X2 [Parasteatoda tepidariorum]